MSQYFQNELYFLHTLMFFSSFLSASLARRERGRVNQDVTRESAVCIRRGADGCPDSSVSEGSDIDIGRDPSVVSPRSPVTTRGHPSEVSRGLG